MQARLYTRILDKVIKQDELFSKFKIVGFKFIVANVDDPQPLVWDCDFYNCASGQLIFGKDNNIILEDPEDKGKELKFYLDNNPKVPNNINLEGENSIKEFLKEM